MGPPGRGGPARGLSIARFASQSKKIANFFFFLSGRVAKSAKKTEKPEPPPKRIVDGDKAIAKHYERSTRTIQTWRDNGLPHEPLPPNSYRYDLDLTDPWVAAFSDQSDESPEATEVRHKISLAKLRTELAKAERLEREEKEATGNILPRDEWESFAVELVHVVRGQFLQLSKQARKHMCAKCQKTVPAEIDRLIDKSLQHIARMKDGPKKG
jgi:phage terminase Nu1 subunit (DNA packaging protein)